MRLRRVLAVALIVMSGAFASTTYGEQVRIDFSVYSDQEIEDFLVQVQEEIAGRGITKTAALEKGVYVGGKDIPIGRYILAKEAGTADSGIVWLRAVDDPENAYPSKLYEFVDDDQESTFYITVDEGDTLSVPFHASLTISAGVLFQ